MGNLCGEHHYGNITKVKVDKILDQLKANGATIGGTNPWDVDVHNNGVKLMGTWNEANLSLSVSKTCCITCIR